MSLRGGILSTRHQDLYRVRILKIRRVQNVNETLRSSCQHSSIFPNAWFPVVEVDLYSRFFVWSSHRIRHAQYRPFYKQAGTSRKHHRYSRMVMLLPDRVRAIYQGRANNPSAALGITPSPWQRPLRPSTESFVTHSFLRDKFDPLKTSSPTPTLLSRLSSSYLIRTEDVSTRTPVFQKPTP